MRSWLRRLIYGLGSMLYCICEICFFNRLHQLCGDVCVEFDFENFDI